MINLLFIQKLKENGKKELAYELLRKQYETNIWQHSGAQQRIEVLIQLAQLSLTVGKPAKCSLPYIDEALILVEDLDQVLQSQYTQCLQSERDEYMARVKR